MPKTNSKEKIEVVKGFRVSPTLNREINYAAFKANRPVSHIIKEAVIEWIERHKREWN